MPTTIIETMTNQFHEITIAQPLPGIPDRLMNKEPFQVLVPLPSGVQSDRSQKREYYEMWEHARQLSFCSQGSEPH